MKPNKGSPLIPLFMKTVGFLAITAFSSNALAEYYIVYSEVQYVSPPPPIVYYQKECAVHKHKKTHKHYKKVVKHKKKSSAIVSVYYINQPCGQCYSGCNQYVTPTAQGCGYKVFYGQPVRHSDYYYMQGFNEDDYGPDIDGNTYDNDIY